MKTLTLTNNQNIEKYTLHFGIFEKNLIDIYLVTKPVRFVVKN